MNVDDFESTTKTDSAEAITSTPRLAPGQSADTETCLDLLQHPSELVRAWALLRLETLDRTAAIRSALSLLPHNVATKHAS